MCLSGRFCFFCFFFQAEDGIRDVAVTGVQTCALPIFRRRYRENAACGLDRELLRGAWPHARHPVARLWRRRAPGSPATRATGGRGGGTPTGGRRRRPAAPKGPRNRARPPPPPPSAGEGT